MRILVVEDDLPLANFVRQGLEAENYTVDVVHDGETACISGEQYDFDLVVLDLSLPRLDGLAVLEHLRKQDQNLPVLVLSGRARVEERVRTLDNGADDYLLKPFSFSELSARVRALLRRGRASPDPLLSFADLTLDRMDRSVERGGKRIELTTKEFALLEYLMRNAGHRVTRAMIIQNVWKLSLETTTNVVDVYVNYLRQKIDHGFSSRLIHTVRGVGYEMRIPQEATP